ncbi:hypothetical protein S7335_3492 [Synechococcus sp. PCC 7335]|nr:hypothetical protein S7335_3492 [Synechococcus sp. PCC 7335]
MPSNPERKWVSSPHDMFGWALMSDRINVVPERSLPTMKIGLSATFNSLALGGLKLL